MIALLDLVLIATAVAVSSSGPKPYPSNIKSMSLNSSRAEYLKPKWMYRSD